MDRASAADRGDGVQRRLREPVSLSRVFPEASTPSRIITGSTRAFAATRATSDDALLRGFTDAARGHGLRVIMDLVVNHTVEGQRAGRHAGRTGSPATRAATCVSPFATDPADPDAARPYGATSPSSTTGRRSSDEIVALFRRSWCAITSGSGFGGFRCDAAYKVPAEVWRGLIGDAKAADARRGVLRRKSRGAEGSGPGARRRRLRLSLQQRQMVGFREPMAARAVRRRFATSRRRSAFPRATTPTGWSPNCWPPAFRRSQIEPRYRQAYAFAAAYSTGVMMPMGFEYGWSRRSRCRADRDDEPEPHTLRPQRRSSPRSTR